jgi:hypothetical protein
MTDYEWNAFVDEIIEEMELIKEICDDINWMRDGF